MISALDCIWWSKAERHGIKTSDRHTNLDHSSWPWLRESTPLRSRPRLNATKEICLEKCLLFRGESRNALKSWKILRNSVHALWPSCRRNSNMIKELAGSFHNLEPSMHDFGVHKGMMQARKRRQWRYVRLACGAIFKKASHLESRQTLWT